MSKQKTMSESLAIIKGNMNILQFEDWKEVEKAYREFGNYSLHPSK